MIFIQIVITSVRGINSSNKASKPVPQYVSHFNALSGGRRHHPPPVSFITDTVYQSDRYTAWWLYPLPTQINAETSSSEDYRNIGLLPSGGFELERKGVGPEGFEPPID
jgi:hypothetical protein